MDNKGFSGIGRVVARSNFSYNLIGSRSQSLTAHIVTVGVQIMKEFLWFYCIFSGRSHKLMNGLQFSDWLKYQFQNREVLRLLISGHKSPVLTSIYKDIFRTIPSTKLVVEPNLEWNVKPILTKTNYLLHTDTVREQKYQPFEN